MSKYRVHVHDHADQGRWLAQQDFARRPTQEQVTAAFPVLSQPGRYEVRLGLLSGEDEINAGGWLQGEPVPAADPGKAEVDPQRLGGQWRGFAHLVRYRGQSFVVSTAGDPDGSGGFASQVFRSDDRGRVTDWDEVAGGPGMSREQAITDLEARPVAALGYIMSPRDVMDQQEAEQDDEHTPCGECGGGYWQPYIGPPESEQHIPHDLSCSRNVAAQAAGTAKRKPVSPELFARTAPQWNCVDYPGDGPHYTPVAGEGCAWCGKSREKMTAEYAAAEGCCGNCQG